MKTPKQWFDVTITDTKIWVIRVEGYDAEDATVAATVKTADTDPSDTHYATDAKPVSRNG